MDAKLLENQIGRGKNEEKNDGNDKPLKDDDNSNIIDLIKKKPTYGGRKRKPTIIRDFD